MGAFRVESKRGPDGAPVPARVGRAGALERVVEWIDRWPGEGYVYFRIRTESGDDWIVRREDGSEPAGWELVFYARGAGPAGSERGP